MNSIGCCKYIRNSLSIYPHQKNRSFALTVMRNFVALSEEIVNCFGEVLPTSHLRTLPHEQRHAKHREVRQV